MECAQSRERGVGALGGYPVGSNRSSAASTLCLDLVEEGGGDLVGGNLASTVPAP